MEIFTRILAEQMDEDIVYGYDCGAWRWHERIMRQELEEMRPRHIPKWLWNKIHGG
jgi:hypothetical protein